MANGGGFIHCYGMFWDRNEIEWAPGTGNKNEFRLLGHVGERQPRLRVCDFRDQRGIYVLYDDHGATYVGLASKQAIGNRLRDHTKDSHKAKWDRFSWFGFRRVKTTKRPDGTQELGVVPQKLLADPQSTIADIEALLIQTLGTYRNGNKNQMKFSSAERWEQVRLDDRRHYLDRI